jgi:serine/threonine protein kinase
MSESGFAPEGASRAETRLDPDRTVAILTEAPGQFAPNTYGADFDRTVMMTGAGNPSVAVAATAFGGNLLPVGARLGEFEISGLIGEGGFGIVYRADDHSLGRVVALKEYMPAALAARTADYSVSIKSERVRETFEIGLRSFINEARMLAQFDHPALVKVYRFWEANGTAYMAMPFYDGVTLKEAIQARAAPPDEAWLRRLLMPLLDALDLLHRNNCVHRDVAPDNIVLLDGESPVLLDFGAARRVIGDATQALTVILKPGYAPIEQYDEIPGMKQGPWTDIYALAAVIHLAIVGKAPATSVSRLVDDRQQPLAERVAGRYSAAFLEAIDRALATQPDARPRSVAHWRALMDGIGDPAPVAAETAEVGGIAMTADAVVAPAEVPERDPVPLAALPSPAFPLPALPSSFSPSLPPLSLSAARPAAPHIGPALRAPGPARWFGIAGVALLLGAATVAWFHGGGASVERILAKVPGTPALAARSDPNMLPAPPAPPPVASLEPAPVAAIPAPAPAAAAPKAPALPRAAVIAPIDPDSEADRAESKSQSPSARPGLREALREARICFAQRRYECTIARARAVLDAEPGNPAAQHLIERARKGQEDALNGDWKMR